MMNKIIKANVFGTLYKVHIIEKPNLYMYENGADAYSDFVSKEIFILKSSDTNRAYRHELLHVFLKECGMRRHANNEELVEVLTEIFQRVMETITEYMESEKQ